MFWPFNRKKSLETNCYVQLTPIKIKGFSTNGLPAMKDLGIDVIDNVIKFINAEVAALMKWTGCKREHVTYSGNILHPGLDTIFLVIFTAFDVEKQGPAFEDFMRDVYSYCQLGGTGTRLNGQSYAKRCRWVKPFSE